MSFIENGFDIPVPKLNSEKAKLNLVIISEAQKF